jgi:hypothetical protein
LGFSPNTLEANVQWFKDRDMDYRKNKLLLNTKTQTKRKKLAWLLREVFDYRGVSENQKKETIRNMYSLVRENPNFLVYSINTLEKKKDKLREKASKYNYN